MIIMVYYKLSPYSWVGFYPSIFQEWQGVCCWYLTFNFVSFCRFCFFVYWNCMKLLYIWKAIVQLPLCRRYLGLCWEANRLSTGSFLNQKVLVLHVYQASSEVDDHGLPPQKVSKIIKQWAFNFEVEVVWENHLMVLLSIEFKIQMNISRVNPYSFSGNPK